MSVCARVWSAVALGKRKGLPCELTSARGAGRAGARESELRACGLASAADVGLASGVMAFFPTNLRPSRLRRVVAILLALCFGLFSAEALIADVHDSDATGRVGKGAVGAAQGMNGSAAVDLHSHQDEAPRSGDSHKMHACHGGHAHTGLIVLALRIDRERVRDVAVRPRRDGPTSTMRREPQLRPPIA
jgi:hypothetical protein